MTRSLRLALVIGACHHASQAPRPSPNHGLPSRLPIVDSIISTDIAIPFLVNHQDPALLAVLLHRLAQLADTSGTSGLDSYCVGIGGALSGASVADPSQQLLDQLRDLRLPVRPYSGCRVQPLRVAERRAVIDTTNGTRAYLLLVTG